MGNLMESMFGRVGGTRQAALVIVGVLVTALVFGVSRWATQPEMVPLFSDIPMENVSKMTDKLTELGIVYELQGAGSTILVSSTDAPKARVALASDGMPETGRPGLELFDKPAWGMTDYTQRVNFSRALEGELERTIGKMRDVKAVHVHLAIENDQLFKQNERASKASVTLTMNNGEAPHAETVHGIASLVSSSVGGLDAQHVTIVDERGQALTTDDDGSMTGLSSRQLAVQREVETYYQQKADKLLMSLVGNGNARVQVSASINFNKVERTVQGIDPDKQALATEQKSEVTPSSPQQGAGYTQSATSYENSKSVESFSGAIGNITRLTVAVLVADKVTLPPVDTTAKTAAVPIVTTRSPEEIARIETLMRSALGVDSTRGDVISVVSAPFDMPAPAPKPDTLPTPDLLTKLQRNPKPIVAMSSLVVLLIVAVLLVTALKPKKPSKAQQEQAALAAAAQYQMLPSSFDASGALGAGMNAEQPQHAMEERRPAMLPPPATTFEREQAMATVDQRPDAAVRVMRGWLRA